MKQIFVSTAFAIALATMAFGCASETTGPSSETGNVGVNLLVGNNDVTAVNFEVTCSDLTVCPLNGQFNVIDRGPNEPPIWATIMDLPVGVPDPIVYTINLTALDDQGAVLCMGDADFTVNELEPTKVNMVLECGGDGEELLGSVDIDATFRIIDGNRCPRLHFLNAVPIDVPAEGSEVTVLVSDADEDPLTTALTTPGGGSFADPAAQSTTYFCDNASGAQTISVTVSDGNAACDKSKSFDVVCPGTDPCEGVTCDDTGNECTAAECVDGECVTSDVDNDTPCGGITDVADNGGVEAGTLVGFTEFCASGTCDVSTMAATGVYAARLSNNTPASDVVLKQANKGIGIVQPGDTITINFAAKGTGAFGGIAKVFIFSERAEGGVSAEFNEQLALTDQYQTFNYEVTAGPDVGGGVTLQFTATTGGDPDSTSELFVDDIVILVEGGGAGTCQEGVCVSNDLCQGVTCDDTGNECTAAECNPTNGVCEESDVANDTLCDNETGTCQGGACVTTDLCEGVVCDDTGNDCTVAECNAANGLCEESNVADETACNNDGGKCNAGFCVPAPTANGFIKTLDPGMDFQVSLIDTVDTTNLPDSWGGYAASISIPDDDAFIGHILQFGFQTNASNFDNTNNFYDNTVLNDPTVLYTQDFNGLDINGTVIGDDWRFFVNVFDSAGTRKFGYGGAAPNGTGFISGIVSGEGGLEQEPQQLSVFSDYNCCQPGEGHFSTDLVETNVFQERTIGADDLGKTLEFVFQAKGGNIGQ